VFTGRARAYRSSPRLEICRRKAAEERERWALHDCLAEDLHERFTNRQAPYRGTLLGGTLYKTGGTLLGYPPMRGETIMVDFAKLLRRKEKNHGT
jgi:hypothetical protein